MHETDQDVGIGVELFMRICFFSDIHANREAFDACFAHAVRQNVDRFVFLGDLVGYGADPTYIVDRVAELQEGGASVVLGNHDLAAASGNVEGMNEYASAAIAWTHATLDQPRRDFLAGLDMKIEEDDRLYVHSEAGAPTQWRYVGDSESAERSLRATRQRLTFCGHIHIPQLFHMTATKPAKFFAPHAGAPIPLVGQRQWLAVLGSVGQPRDKNPSAAYGVLDTTKNEFTFLRVPYDVEEAARKIHEAGLPQILAARLFIGR
ncbi:MAG: putative phosphohydrolase, superfamily [Hyphomicrobiales bacterium]|nr:putative phosphohydrolase, superfamily [Hyphomicrobiales bacterium]